MYLPPTDLFIMYLVLVLLFWVNTDTDLGPRSGSRKTDFSGRVLQIGVPQSMEGYSKRITRIIVTACP